MRRSLIFSVTVAAWLAAPTAAMATDASPSFTPSLSAGKKIYQTGLEGPGRAASSCSACHGRTGLGKLEAGVQIPPIAFDALAAPGSNSNGPRSAYDEASLRRAVTKGIGASGRPLGAVMPRQPLTDAQWSDLYRYLTVLGSSEDRDPGVGDQVLRIGTVLPLTGPSAAIGAGARASIEATFAQVNSRGGISVALYNTLLGIGVAIPAVIFYRHFRNRVDVLVVEMESQAIKLIEIIHGERRA